MLDETFVMNACKEDCCYVARDWAEEVRVARKKGPQNTLARDYVLPGKTGHWKIFGPDPGRFNTDRDPHFTPK